eukprot:Gb_20555 [translate_table: standard]
MAPNHPNYVTLKNAGLRNYFLLPKLFYEDHSITEAIALMARHPELLQIIDEVVHVITRLPFDAPDVPKGNRASREEVAKEFCKSNFSTSGIPLERLKDNNMRWIAKLTVVKLFGLQRYTRGTRDSSMTTWCTLYGMWRWFNSSEEAKLGDETTPWLGGEPMNGWGSRGRKIEEEKRKSISSSQIKETSAIITPRTRTSSSRIIQKAGRG